MKKLILCQLTWVHYQDQCGGIYGVSKFSIDFSSYKLKYDIHSVLGKLSPAFGSSRVKAMFSYLIDSGSSLQNHLDKLADSGEFLDVLEIASCYTTNVIASVAFGVEVDSIADPNTEFRICTRKMFEPSLMNGFRLMLMFLSPKLMDILRIKTVCSSVEKFLVSLVKQNLEYREKNNVIRKDFFQLLIQLR